MIEMFSLATAHLFQDALASQARLRYRVFVVERELPHSHFNDLEFDEFDTPAAVYLVWRDEQRIVRGVVRLLRTDRPYMMKSYWPELARNELPSSDKIWEVTRVCVDRSVSSSVRQMILPKLLCAIEEFFADVGATGMIGVTRAHLLSHFVRRGIQWLGESALVEGQMERAFYVPRGCIRPDHHCAKYNIGPSVLSDASASGRVAA